MLKTSYVFTFVFDQDEPEPLYDDSGNEAEYTRCMECIAFNNEPPHETEGVTGSSFSHLPPTQESSSSKCSRRKRVTRRRQSLQQASRATVCLPEWSKQVSRATAYLPEWSEQVSSKVTACLSEGFKQALRAEKAYLLEISKEASRMTASCQSLLSRHR